MSMEKEKRKNRFTIRFTESETACLMEKMKQIGIASTAAYIRSMALNGLILRVDLPEIRELLRLLRNMTNNLNQIARRLNTHGQIYETEIEELQQRQTEMWSMMRALLSRLETTQ